MKSTDKYVLVLMASLALFLAGCGGGSSSTPSTGNPGPTAGETAIMNAKQALSSAQAAVGSATTDQGRLAAQQGVVQAASNLIDVLTANGGSAADIRAASNALADARNAIATLTSAIDEAGMAMMAMVRKLYMGLDNNDDDNGALNGATDATVTMSGMDLTVDPDGADTGFASVTVKPSGTTVAPLNGWKGTDYVNTTSGVTNHLVLYSNRGATTQPFIEKWGPAAAVTANQIADAAGRISITDTTAADRAPNVAGGDFATVGTKAHTENPGDQVSVSGTFDGASGTYSCIHGAAACTSAKATSGFTLEGGWFFTPAPGATTSTPEASWQVFGWWSRETANGVDVKAIVEDAGTAEVLTANPTVAVGGTTTAVEGTATYRGGAAGKYSIYNPFGMSHAGAFTADAVLTANFSAAAANAKISGELTGFTSGGNAMDWSVAFEETAIASGAFSDTTDGTVWTIGGTAAAKSGSWEGDFYDPNTTTGVPGTAAGTFTSAYGNTGHMVGAFGADLED